MKLRIEYSGPLRTAVGRREEEVDVAETTTLGGLLRELAARLDNVAAVHLTTATGQVPSGLLIVVNGAAIASSQMHSLALHNGDVIALLPPIAGG